MTKPGSPYLDSPGVTRVAGLYGKTWPRTSFSSQNAFPPRISFRACRHTSNQRWKKDDGTAAGPLSMHSRQGNPASVVYVTIEEFLEYTNCAAWSVKYMNN